MSGARELPPEYEPYRLYLETMTEEEYVTYTIARAYIPGVFNTLRNAHYMAWAKANPEKHAEVCRLHFAAPAPAREWGIKLTYPS